MKSKNKVIKPPMQAQEYEAWMLEAAQKWIRDGWSLNSFSGKHNVNSHVWNCLLRDQPELQTIKEEYNEIKKRDQQRTKYRGHLN